MMPQTKEIQIQFSENGTDWIHPPPWVIFLIEFGYGWHHANLRQQRIAIISLPSGTPAAGLVALGALIRDLTSLETSDAIGYFEGLLRYTRQYLEKCRECTLRCHPEIRRCGYLREATGKVKDLLTRKIYYISEKSSPADRKLVLPIENGSWTIMSAERAKTLRIEDRPPITAVNDQGALSSDLYSAIIKDAPILSRNLRESFSGLALAGKSTGRRASEESYSSIHFRIGTTIHRLSELLRRYKSRY
ncbi:hypothetical protein SAMN05444581_1491 [Methylocapsa palsarum]|uniref:Uncharacterized protein n=2 Tax=Methylocapsa palsarum TaxID=1612308 RepID=A0A1I4D9V9_9HYPH|nr:hypothetical protein SAMN05444581_1491 [Methylocapsa palsarum]